MADERVRGSSLLGDEPKRLELSDGSRLVLDGSAERDRIEWRRLGRGCLDWYRHEADRLEDQLSEARY